MTEVTISYSLTDGVLLLGTSRGDGSNIALKQFNSKWRWSPYLRSWYVYGSRNKPADALLIQLSKEALEDAGFTVAVTGDVQTLHERVQTKVQAEEQPRVTPLTVAQRAKQRTATNGEAANGNGHMQVHVKPDGDVVLDLGSGDTQTAVDFIRTLLQSRKNPGVRVAATFSEADHIAGMVEPFYQAEQPESLLKRIREAPKELGIHEGLVWSYLRANDSEAGVRLLDIRRHFDFRDAQASATLRRLKRKGFAVSVSLGRWRALTLKDVDD